LTRSHDGDGQDSLGLLFRLFLGFGLRAWGGPAAQIAMIRDSVVDEWKWTTQERFNRLLGIYQVLPGPEATEMCVHFGHQRRGRLGGLVAGLGFMLPGFLLMLALAVLYVEFLAGRDGVLDLLVGFPAAVVALVAVACIRLGTHALHDERLTLLGLWAGLMTAAHAPFWVVLPAAGLAYLRPSRLLFAAALAAGTGLGLFFAADDAGAIMSGMGEGRTSAWLLGRSGLKAGLLTFGGAYTALPFLQKDAVGHYASGQQFIDGVALSGILPAPFIIFATFLGYVAGGFAGAVLMTVGIFLPAFAFTLLGADHLDRLAHHPLLHPFLDGVTAAVIGLLAATMFGLLLALGESQFLLALAAFFLLLRWNAKWTVPVVVLACGAVGAAVHTV
jgi:chromate transporter